MATHSSRPIRLLTIGRIASIAQQVEAALPEHITFPAIIDAEHFSVANLELVVLSLNPPADGVFVGSGVPEEVAKEVERWIEKWNEGVRGQAVEDETNREGAGGVGVDERRRKELKFVTQEVGHLRKYGWEKTVDGIRENIEQAFA